MNKVLILRNAIDIPASNGKTYRIKPKCFIEVTEHGCLISQFTYRSIRKIPKETLEEGNPIDLIQLLSKVIKEKRDNGDYLPPTKSKDYDFEVKAAFTTDAGTTVLFDIYPSSDRSNNQIMIDVDGYSNPGEMELEDLQSPESFSTYLRRFMEDSLEEEIDQEMEDKDISI